MVSHFLGVDAMLLEALPKRVDPAPRR